jgi:ElaB/YqjD/DUF883 family membrane-anchored ribosome-binding protein
MPNISDHTITDVHEKMAEIQQLADEIADVMAQAGMEQSHSTYMDSRCARIKQLCQDIRAAVGVGMGTEPSRS